MGEIAAGGLASIAGSALGNMMGGSGDDPAKAVNANVNRMNQLLNTTLQNSMAANQQGTNQAVAQQNQSLQSALQAFQSGTGQGTQALNQGFVNSQALQSPYSSIGYGASDKLADSLGIPRAAMGGQALAQSMFQFNQLNPQLQAYQAAAKTAGANPYGQLTAAPTYQTPNVGPAPTPTTAQDLINQWNQSSQKNIPIGGWENTTQGRLYAEKYAGELNNTANFNYNQQAASAQQAAAAQYNSAVGLWSPYAQHYNSLNQSLSGMNTQQLQQALGAQQGLFGPARQVNVGPGGSI